MEGAHGVLLSIYGGSDLGLFEINEAASLVAEAAHPEANIIFGAVIDDTLGDEVRVTVIAAGFDSGQLPYKKVDIRREPAAAARQAPATAAAQSCRPADRRRSSRATNARTAAAGARDPHAGQPRRRPRRPGLPQVLTSLRRRSSTRRARPTPERPSSPASLGGGPRPDRPRLRVGRARPALGDADRGHQDLPGHRRRGARPARRARRRREQGPGGPHQGRASWPARRPPVRWHLVGRLQTNKARSVRRLRPRRALGRPRQAGRARSPTRRRASSAATRSRSSSRSASTATPTAAGCSTPTCPRSPTWSPTRTELRLRGLMAVAPIDADPERAFARLARARRAGARAPPRRPVDLGGHEQRPRGGDRQRRDTRACRYGVARPSRHHFSDSVQLRSRNPTDVSRQQEEPDARSHAPDGRVSRPGRGRRVRRR